MSDKYASTSPYAYCRNNPIILLDPNGEFDTRAEARKYRKEHHTGGMIKKNPENDHFSGKYSIVNKRSKTFYTRPQYDKTDDVPICGQRNEGVVCGPIIYPELSSKAGTVMASTLIICAGIGTDDVTFAGIADDALIPFVFVTGAVTYGGIMLFAHIKKKQSTGKSNSDRHENQYMHGGKKTS
jgi:hypothetical protein